MFTAPCKLMVKSISLVYAWRRFLTEETSTSGRLS